LGRTGKVDKERARVIGEGCNILAFSLTYEFLDRNLHSDGLVYRQNNWGFISSSLDNSLTCASRTHTENSINLKVTVKIIRTVT